MRYLKKFNESLSSIVDDIKEMYIDFRDEWGFTETTNFHNPVDNDCTWRCKCPKNELLVHTSFTGNVRSVGFFISMSFMIGNQDVESCYNSLKEMCDRISALDSELKVYHSKSYSDLGNLFFSVDIFPRKNNI